MTTATAKPDTATVTVPITVKWSRVADLLINAFEGGSNYWYRIEKWHAPPGAPESWPVRADEAAVFRHADYPTNPGGWVEVSDFHGVDGDAQAMKRTRVSRPALLAGLEKWAKGHPASFARWLAENDDANDADVFLQYVVLGEVVYG